MSTWATKWTGTFPNLCTGRWYLYKDGREVMNPFLDGPAETFGEYERWRFDENFNEYWEKYEDGLQAPEWIKKYRKWLELIADEDEFLDIFLAFQRNDFRELSCGGCI